MYKYYRNASKIKYSFKALNIITGADPYSEYERRKKEIQSQNLTPHECEKAMRRLADELNI